MLRFVRNYATRFRENDLAIITPLRKGASSKKWISRPMKPGSKFNIDTGSFPFDDIIGTFPRSKIYQTKGKRLSKYIISAPTTEEYINLTGRDAQPIYPLDAAAIVTLADLHLDYPEVDSEGNLANPPLQFFEAGTGHGSLTLQIAKAIHSANAFAKFSGDCSKRGAILHSVDCNERHSKTGQRTIEGFKGGMYSNDVEFHLSESPTDWFEQSAPEWRMLTPQAQDETDFQDPEAFISGMFLDMGGFENHLGAVAKNLLLDAPLLVFCPSLSQVMDALKILDENPQIQLQFVKTVQLLDGAGGGLKEWDTRKTFIKATSKQGWVCRPKVGVRVCGGGFVVIFTKPAININIAEELKEIDDYIPEPKEEYVPPDVGKDDAEEPKKTGSETVVDANDKLKNSDTKTDPPEHEHRDL